MDSKDIPLPSHPINHCPEDIVKIIFEATMNPLIRPAVYCFDSPQFRTPLILYGNLVQATRMAGVCVRWRTIALDTPRLWSDVTLEMGSDVAKLQDYWLRTKQRVKSAPLTIRISDICLEGSRSLSTIGFETSLNIESVQLHFEHLVDLDMLPEMLGGSTLDVMDMTVSIGRRRFHPRETSFHPKDIPEVDLDCGSLLKQVKCRRRLTIEQDSWLNLGGIGCTPLLHLELTRLRFDLTELFAVFPRLEKLALYGCLFTLPATTTRVTRLLSLTVNSYRLDEWFTNVHFPDLDILSIRWSPCKGLGAFLASHRTITTLDVEVSGASMEEMEEIAAVSPQLETLELDVSDASPHMGYAWAHSLISNGAFPLLKSLTINDWDGYFPGSLFEGIVRDRCLPRSHPQSTTQGLAKFIDKFFMAGVPGSRNSWCTAPLYLLANKQAVEYITESGEKLMITQLEWEALDD